MPTQRKINVPLVKPPKRIPVKGLSGRHEDLHQMISFEDPNEQRTWMIDATYMLSNWKCIFGEGCHGVLDEPARHLNEGCCSYGAHFVDEDDVANVVKHVVKLDDTNWQYKGRAANKGFLETTKDGETKTRTVDGACIFLNRPGFIGGEGCAFHIAALANGDRPLDYKPNVCWQVPLRIEHHTDESGWVTSYVREWKRRDWGSDADLHWWCTDTPDAFVGRDPVYKYLRDEIIELVGLKVYELMVEVLEHRERAPLPHPATTVLKKR